jgi:hypothetical protein
MVVVAAAALRAGSLGDELALIGLRERCFRAALSGKDAAGVAWWWAAEARSAVGG